MSISICFWDDELFTIGAALEVAMKECESQKQYGLADRFAELYKRVDDVIRERSEKNIAQTKFFECVDREFSRQDNE